MLHFFNDYFKNRNKYGTVIQKGSGLRNASNSTKEYVVSTGKTARFTMSPQSESKVTVVDPNTKTVNQAKEELKRDEAEQVIIPVQTGIKRKAKNTSDTSQKKKQPKKKKSTEKPKTALSM